MFDTLVRRIDGVLDRPGNATLARAADAALSVAVRGALVAGSLAEGRTFWAQAALGRNQLAMHDVTRDGEISIGGVSEQLYGEGFLAAWHQVLGRELGDRLPAVLYEVGYQGAVWEVRQAIDRGVWVPRALRPLIGRPELLERAAHSRVYRALILESLRILFRMIMTEGGWGRVTRIELDAAAAAVEVDNTPEPRRVGATGAPGCHLMTGIYAAYFATIFGTEARAVESRCVSAGAPACRFDVTFTR
jgi:predicted hydrocarbon binding protein